MLTLGSYNFLTFLNERPFCFAVFRISRRPTQILSKTLAHFETSGVLTVYINRDSMHLLYFFLNSLNIFTIASIYNSIQTTSSRYRRPFSFPIRFAKPILFLCLDLMPGLKFDRVQCTNI